MLFFYNLITFLYLPIALIKLFYKKNFSLKEIDRVKERFGFISKEILKSSKKIIWIHAVSVGEVNTSINLIKNLQKTFPDKSILVTTTTSTGSERLKKIFKDDIFHQYLPFDVIFFIKRFLTFWKPNGLILIETEIWPNLINQCSKRKIPVMLLNGRLSIKSLNNYKKMKTLFFKTFSKINLIIAQTDEDRNNFIEIGANSKKVIVDASLKFDALDESPLKPSFSFDEELLKERKIITCASTHTKEEEILFRSFKLLDDEFSHLVLVPRHPQRAETIGEFLKKENVSFSFLKIKDKFHLDLNNKISIVNEIGHLNLLYSISDIAFIGGTLIKHGGQNFLEPLSHGLPISSGNSVYNFQEIANQLLELKILKYGNSAEEISSIWRDELSKKNNHLIKKKSFDYISSKKGSLKRSIEKVKELIK